MAGARVQQPLAIGGLNEAVQTGFPVLHGHGDLALRYVIGHIQIGVDHAGELGHLNLGKVVLGDDHIEFPNFDLWRVFP